MKRKRKFYFKKHIMVLNYEKGETVFDDKYKYRVASNDSLIAIIINLLAKNKIDYSRDLIKGSFDDFEFCWVEIKSTRQDYFKFVIDFMDACDGGMDDYKIGRGRRRRNGYEY